MYENGSTNSTPLVLRKAITICFESDHPAIKASRVLAYTVILLVSLTGNSLVIGVLWQNRKMRKPVNYLIANMAAADLAITVVYMPQMISSVVRSYEWLVGGTLGLVLCKTVPTLHLVSIKVSILTLVFLSVERFLAVSVFARNKLTVRRVKIIIFSVWLASLAVHVPNMCALKLIPGQGGGMVCRARLNKFFGSSKGRKIYDNTLAAIFYAIPLFLIVLLYSLAAIKLRKRNVPGGNADANGRNTRNTPKEKINTNVFKMLFAVTTAFISCWLSYFIMRKGIIGTSISCNVQFIRYFLAHANCAATPCLYIIFSQKYRSCFKSILRRLACCVSVRVRSGTTLSPISQSATSFGSLSVLPRGVSLISLRFKMEDRITA
ncbi:hypothetical protein OS493_033103 [Desmophyllum pertusum]|uniref:G-protein coupled receptors family 1 profile domain-containing protein n=1 Tax=Desmophyllum pertusum TaxID=174260 RepID=A0A9W9YVN7_9CNID|nr:hypothetical protein OS493_033103 [Desmophyllum pertusum]